MLGCSASTSFSNCARVITVLQASPCKLESAQKPLSVITGSSGATLTSGAAAGAPAGGAAGALCPAGAAGEAGGAA